MITSARTPSCRPAIESLESRECLSTVTLDYNDSGWYRDVGKHNDFNENYLVGRYAPDVLYDYHNFFVFGLQSIDKPILAAHLTIQTRNYLSPDPSETYALYDVSTPIPELTASWNDRTDIYDDLGSGQQLGKRMVSGSDGTFIRIRMNGDGISYLNSHAGEDVGIGGALTTLDGFDEQFVFGQTGAATDVRKLVLTLDDSRQLGPWHGLTEHLSFADASQQAMGAPDSLRAAFIASPSEVAPATDVAGEESADVIRTKPAEAIAARRLPNQVRVADPLGLNFA